MIMLFKQAIEITREQAINHSRKEYNPREWERIVNRYDAQDEATFYDLGMGGYNQDEVGVVYMSNGIRSFRILRYSSSLAAYDGVGQINLYDDGVSLTKFKDAQGNEGYISSRENANYLRRMSTNYNHFIVATPFL